MRSFERLINFVQIFASVCLGISFFLPFYKSAIGEVNYVDEGFLFFWTIPILIIIFTSSNGWLKAIFCVLSAIGAFIPLLLLTFAATFKSTPQIGFYTAKTSIFILIISWLILSVVTIRIAKLYKNQQTISK